MLRRRGVALGLLNLNRYIQCSAFRLLIPWGGIIDLPELCHRLTILESGIGDFPVEWGLVQPGVAQPCAK